MWQLGYRRPGRQRLGCLWGVQGVQCHLLLRHPHFELTWMSGLGQTLVVSRTSHRTAIMAAAALHAQPVVLSWSQAALEVFGAAAAAAAAAAPRAGPTDVFHAPTAGSLWLAVGYTRPALHTNSGAPALPAAASAQNRTATNWLGNLKPIQSTDKPCRGCEPGRHATAQHQALWRPWGACQQAVQFEVCLRARVRRQPRSSSALYQRMTASKHVLVSRAAARALTVWGEVGDFLHRIGALPKLMPPSDVQGKALLK